MLILTRRIGESLRVGDDVSLMVLGVNGNQARIGIDAPKHISVHREEIYQRIQNERAAASSLNAPGESVSGTISYINKEKGFGYIYAGQFPNQIFFLAKSIQEGNFAELEEGDTVEFHVSTGPKGLVANELSVVGEEKHL